LKNIHRGIALIPMLILLTVRAHGDTLSGTGGLQTWSAGALGTTSTPTPSGTPYWNNPSGDGSTNNIGWCLTGTGGCSLANPPGTVPYYANSNGTAATSMIFTASGTPVAATLLGIFTNQSGPPSGTDYFGWYEINPNNTLGAMSQLFSSLAAVGTTATFDPTGEYGFYIENVQSAGKSYEADYYWFMSSGFDTATGTGTNDGQQHFATFALPNGSYLLGMEDTNNPGTDNDFNDLVVQVQNTPEPASMALLGGGLLLLGWKTRRRRER
jgi:hypothetical protein